MIEFPEVAESGMAAFEHRYKKTDLKKGKQQQRNHSF